MKILLLVCCLISTGFAQTAQSRASFESSYAQRDVALTTNPNSAFWQIARPVVMQVDIQGHPVPDGKTKVRSRWTGTSIYFLFTCPYSELFLKPNPNTQKETFELWNWDVAEVFIGTDFQQIKHYKEFEISPQGEWIDLDIDLNKPHHEEGWVWNSGFEHKARIDRAHHTWYAAIRIPFAALDTPRPQPGTQFRVNLFRTEGPSGRTKQILWQPTMKETFHVPEQFGILNLAGK